MHVATFHLRLLLDDGEILQIIGQLLENCQTLLGSNALSICVSEDAKLRAIDSDKANGGGADCVVDPRLLSGYAAHLQIKKPVSTGLTGFAVQL